MLAHVSFSEDLFKIGDRNFARKLSGPLPKTRPKKLQFSQF